MKGMRPFTDREIAALSRQLGRRRDGARDVALLTLGIQTGFRISELLSITLSDLVVDGRIAEQISVARRHMKKQFEGRTVRLAPGTRERLADWIDELGRRGYQAADDFVFQSRVAGNRAISKSHAWNIVHRAARACGITGPIGTHSMRKTFADRMYAVFEKKYKGKDTTGMGALRAVSKSLGHANINNTDKYLSFREEDIDSAIRQIWG